MKVFSNQSEISRYNLKRFTFLSTTVHILITIRSQKKKYYQNMNKSLLDHEPKEIFMNFLHIFFVMKQQTDHNEI